MVITYDTIVWAVLNDDGVILVKVIIESIEKVIVNKRYINP